MVNKEFIIAGINNLLKTNYGIDIQTIDVEAYVDSTLTYGENWNLIKKMINLNSIPYKYLRCKYCSRQIRCEWEYCPKCGKPLEGKHE